MWMEIVTYTCNLNTKRLRHEAHEFRDNWVRSFYLKKKVICALF